MITIHKDIVNRGMKTRMILQVHDELVFDVPLEEVEEAQLLIKTGMSNAMKLPHEVPLNVETGKGDNWLEAH